MRRIEIFAVVLSLFAATATYAEDPSASRGMPLDGVFQVNDVDTINVFNGNLIINPISIQFPLNGGSSYGIHIVYTGIPFDLPVKLDASATPEPKNRADPTPNRRSNAGLGWRISMGRLVAPGDVTSEGCGASFNPCGWAYESPDGARHTFFDRLHATDTSTDTGVLYTRDASYLRLKQYNNTYQEVEFPNGQIHRFDMSGNLTQIYTPFDRAANGDPSVTVKTVLNDPVTNPCHDAGASFCWQIDQPLTANTSRTQYVTFVPAPNLYGGWTARRIIVNAPGSDSSTVTYSFYYNNSTSIDYDSSTDVDLAYDMIGCYDRFQNPGHHLVPMLTAIGLPDGTKYAFEMYNGDPGMCQQGSLTSMTLPTGGQIQYSYTDFLPIGGGKRAEDPPYSPGVRTRKKSPSGSGPAMQWDYEPAVGDYNPLPGGTLGRNPRELLVTVTDPVTVADPDQRKTKHYFSIARQNYNDENWRAAEYGLPFTHATTVTSPATQLTMYLSSVVMNGTAADRSVYVRYEQDTPPSTFSTHFDNWREAATLTTYGGTAAGYWKSAERSDFDGFGNYRQTVTDGNFHLDSPSDLEVDSQSRDKVTSFVGYNAARGTWGSNYSPWPSASPWVLGTFDQQWTNVGMHTKKTELCFEAATGFLSRARTLANDAATAGSLTTSGVDLIAVYSHDAPGNLTVEQQYGGETTPYCASSGTSAPTGSLCSLTLSGPRYEVRHTYQNCVRATSQPYENGVAMGFFTLDRTIDLSGTVSKERDAAGVETTIARDDDPLRVGSVSTPGTAAITYAYTSADPSQGTPAKVTVTQDGVVSRVDYDSFGRLWREYRTVPARSGETQVQRETLYDSANRVASRSMWEPSGTFSKKTTYTYDFIGRLTAESAPDQQVVTTQFTGDSKRQITTKVFMSTDANGAQSSMTRTERLDAYGRLFKLTEPNDTVTSYLYGVTGALTHVCMNDTSSGCGQERTFTYDNRALLTSETHPENGAISYTYDAGGHVLTKRPATPNTVFDLNFCYDGAARLVRVDSRNPYYDPAHPASNPEFRNMKTMTFASANAGTNRKAGKLETAVRHNYHPSVGDVVVTETYAYADDAGRLTDRTTEIRLAPRVLQTLKQSVVSFTRLGAPSTVSYPACISSVPCGQRNDSYTFQYTDGFLTSVVNYATLAYHPSGMIDQVVHTNGIADTYAVDANTLIPRPQAINFSSYDACARPQVTALTPSQTVAPNAIVDLTVTASGAGLTYQWYSSSQPISGATSAIYRAGPLTATANYYVTVTNPCGTVQSPPIVLTVAAPPGITTQPGDASVSPGGTTRLSVVASGTTPSYQWYQGQSGVITVPVGQGQSYFDTPALTATTQYWVRVSNAAGSVDSRTATVTVTSPPPAPSSLVATMLSQASVQLTWVGSAGVDHYEIWRRENGIASRVVNTSSTIPYVDNGLTANVTYVYQVVAVGSGGSSPKSNIDLATTMSFANVAAGVPVGVAQFEQLRAALNAVRAASGAVPVQWSDILQGSPPPPAPAVGVVIRGEHVMALRRSMDQALSWLGIAAMPYTDPTLPGSPALRIRAIHVTELRSRAQ
jgi:YD repeat-containing protein